MGATLSSPQLGDGLVLVANPNTTGPFTSAFTVDASDTNSFGFSATMMNMGTVLQVQYTNTANIVKTATCSAQTYSYITYTDYYDDNGGHVTSTGYRTDADTTFASIFCPIANTQIGTGPMILSLSNRPNDPTWFPSPATYALYFGPTSNNIFSNRNFDSLWDYRDRGEHHNTYWDILRISLSGLADLLADNSIDINEKFFLCAIFLSDTLRVSFFIEEFELEIVLKDHQLVFQSFDLVKDSVIIEV
ncbi:hypothetical protein KCU81_g9810, partial [Aureobasidium melanogenum]